MLKTIRTAAAAAALALACAAPAQQAPQPPAPPSAPAPVPTTSSSFERHVTTVGDHEIVIEIRDDKITTATVDGQPVDPSSIERLDDGGFRIDQPGEAQDFQFDVRLRPDEQAPTPPQIVVIGPDGDPVTVEIPDFANPSDAALWRASHGVNLFAHDDAPRQPPPKVMIGVQMSTPGAELAGHLGIDPAETTLVSAVYKDLPAAKAGLEQYDIIVGINGDKGAGGEALREALADAEPGDTLTLTILHRGQQRDIEITLAPWDEKALAQGLPNAAHRDEELRQALQLARMRPGAGAWAGENGAATFTFPTVPARALGFESAATAERLDRLEKQLQRVEEILSRIELEQAGKPSTTPAPRPPTTPAPPGPPALPHDSFHQWEQRV